MDSLGGSERRIAEIILRDPEPFIGVGLAELAVAAEVSQPTVIRFCRKLGFSGYSDFKVAFAQGIAVIPAALHQDVTADDNVLAILHKIADSALAAITSARDSIDIENVARAASLIANSHRVECFGNGAARVVAVEAHNKIYRLGIPCAITADVFTQTILASTLQENDVVLYISFSGEADLHLESLELAKSAGAQVIAITKPGSKIARAADVSIAVSVAEDFESFTPISTPVTFMIAVDTIAMCAAQLLPKEVSERHAVGKTALARHTRP